MVVFQCRDNFDSILCGIYDAWMSRLGHENVRLEMEDKGNLEMFSEYRLVEDSEEKRDKVMDAIKKKTGRESFENVYKASLSNEEGKADKIYRYLIHAFHYGSKVVGMLQIPAVFDLFQMCRYVGNETHLLTGFVRFSQTEEGILIGRIGPKNDVLVLLAPHFADRLSGENWILYDENRAKAVIHPANGRWILMQMDSQIWRERLTKGSDEAEYENLWKAFHRGIAIRERTNPVCQRTHLPIRYRPYMTEFDEKEVKGKEQH